MTIREIEESAKEMLSPNDIADIFGSDPATIRESVKQGLPGFEALQPVVVGNRVKFPKARFLKWVKGEEVTS